MGPWVRGGHAQEVCPRPPGPLAPAPLAPGPPAPLAPRAPARGVRRPLRIDEGRQQSMRGSRRLVSCLRAQSFTVTSTVILCKSSSVIHPVCKSSSVIHPVCKSSSVSHQAAMYSSHACTCPGMHRPSPGGLAARMYLSVGSGTAQCVWTRWMWRGNREPGA